MPDLNNSIEVDGKYYYWDFEKGQFILVDLKPLDNSQVPQKVIAAFINDLPKKRSIYENTAKDEAKKLITQAFELLERSNRIIQEEAIKNQPILGSAGNR